MARVGEVAPPPSERVEAARIVMAVMIEKRLDLLVEDMDPTTATDDEMVAFAVQMAVEARAFALKLGTERPGELRHHPARRTVEGPLGSPGGLRLLTCDLFAVPPSFFDADCTCRFSRTEYPYPPPRNRAPGRPP